MYVILWNPESEGAPKPSFLDDNLRSGKIYSGKNWRWSVSGLRNFEFGQDVYLQIVGNKHERGIVAKGRSVDTHFGEHYASKNRPPINYLEIQWEEAVPFNEPLTVEELSNLGLGEWKTPRRSGYKFDEQWSRAVASAWASHFNQSSVLYPKSLLKKDSHHSLQILEKATQALPVLKKYASQQKEITYTQLGKAIDVTPRVVGKVLAPLQDICVENGYPLLTAIVVGSGSSKPGKGSFTRDYERDRKRVFAFDWATAAFFENLEGNIETQVEDTVRASKVLDETTKERIIKSRVGQGYFRSEVLRLQPACVLTGVSDEKALRASHIKPWRDSDNMERIDPFNGLALSPHIDWLFDRGHISFENNGRLLVSKHLDRKILKFWNLTLRKVQPFEIERHKYLAWHRKNVFERKLDR